MSFDLIDFLSLIGALGLFIYGMKVMSDAIQKVAGVKLREILEAMTSRRILGLLTGLLLTGLVQSSSASSVMVVSFVNAGLITLVESNIGVIMGAEYRHHYYWPAPLPSWGMGPFSIASFWTSLAGTGFSHALQWP
ncbi:MAG: Na/Pi symporter [Owenweeksia sp.]|nr:Na/Pi symporter [Owenweeksia sp.]